MVNMIERKGYMESEDRSEVESEILRRLVKGRRRDRKRNLPFPSPKHLVNRHGAFWQAVMLSVSLPPIPCLGWSAEWVCCMYVLMNWFLQEERKIDSKG